MRVLVSYNRCLYQDGDWRDEHYAEVDSGMFVVYAIVRSAQGSMKRIRSAAANGLEITVQYEDEGGSIRSVVWLASSIRAKEAWLHQLNGATRLSGSRDELVFEGVAVKSPTRDANGEQLGQSPASSKTRKRDSILTAQWDALTSFMGAWHRRLFRLFADGSLTYHEVTPVACISLIDPSSRIVVEVSPRSRNEAGAEVYALTISSCASNTSLPKIPTESIPAINQLTRRLSKAMGSFSAPKIEENDAQGPPRASSSFLSCVTIGTLESQTTRDEWLRQIRVYSSCFSRQSEVLAIDLPTRVLYKGWGYKKGQGPFAGWKLRYFVLFSDRHLRYFEQEKDVTQIGVIDLKRKRGVRIGQSSEKPQGFDEVIEIETTNRLWLISPQAMNRGEHGLLMKEWLKAITEAEMEGKEYEDRHISALNATNASVAKFFDDKGLSADMSIAVPEFRLSSWERMTGNIPRGLLSSVSMEGASHTATDQT